jgi:hypothetical protein
VIPLGEKDGERKPNIAETSNCNFHKDMILFRLRGVNSLQDDSIAHKQ